MHDCNAHAYGTQKETHGGDDISLIRSLFIPIGTNCRVNTKIDRRLETSWLDSVSPRLNLSRVLGPEGSGRIERVFSCGYILDIFSLFL